MLRTSTLSSLPPSLSDFPPWRAHAQAREYDHARRVGVAAALIAWATMLASLTTVLAWTSSRLSPNTAYVASMYSSMALAGILACMGVGACIYALFYLDAQRVSQLVGFCISYILRTWMDVHTHTHTRTHTRTHARTRARARAHTHTSSPHSRSEEASVSGEVTDSSRLVWR